MNNSLKYCHAYDESELSTYNYIKTLDFLSIAIYKTQENKRPMAPFTHSHNAYEFIIPNDTIPLFFYENADYPGEVGYCYPVNPNAHHGIEMPLNSELISIAVDKQMLDLYKEELGFKDKLFFTRFILSKDAYELIDKLVDESKKSNDNIDFLNYIAEHLIKILITDGLSSDIDNRREEKKYAPKIVESIMFMCEHFREDDLSIEKIANHTDYSTTYFTKLFRAFMHDTPINHLNRIRISEAKRLFRNEEYTIKDIAYMVGYNNFSTFTMAFTRITGIKPKEYRKKYY